MLHIDQDDLENEMMDEIAESDYIFVIDGSGNLKSVILPENFEATTAPANVSTILDMFNFNYFYLFKCIIKSNYLSLIYQLQKDSFLLIDNENYINKNIFVIQKKVIFLILFI